MVSRSDNCAKRPGRLVITLSQIWSCLSFDKLLIASGRCPKYVQPDILKVVSALRDMTLRGTP